jgi:hypothetical protein
VRAALRGVRGCPACQVMAEGTWDAAAEAPHVFAAMDALAARAAAWAERRQRLRVEAAPAGGAELQDAHEAGAAAAAEVKKVGARDPPPP